MDNKKLLKLASMLAKFQKYPTDNGVLVTAEDLAVGVEVMTEEGEAVADGEYKYEDKKIIVKDGKVEEILEVEDEPVEENPADAQPADEAKPADEDMQKKCGLEGEQPADEQPAQPQEAPADEQPQEDDKDLKIKELEGLLADRDAVIEELTQKIKELEDKIAQPVEQPVAMNRVEKIGASKDNKALKFFEEK